jgi:hypothetical protein
MKRGKAQHFFVHRLVAMTFLNKPEQCTEVNHRDKNRCNNHVDNLEWTTHEQNITHKYGDGTDDVNVIEHDSSRIVAICKSITEAERFTGIAFGTIKKYIDTEMSIKGFRFEKGF